MRKNQKFATTFKQVQNIVPETSSGEGEAGFIYSIFHENSAPMVPVRLYT